MRLALNRGDLHPYHEDMEFNKIRLEHLRPEIQAAVITIGKATVIEGNDYNTIYVPKRCRHTTPEFANALQANTPPWESHNIETSSRCHRCAFVEDARQREQKSTFDFPGRCFIEILSKFELRSTTDDSLLLSAGETAVIVTIADDAHTFTGQTNKNRHTVPRHWLVECGALQPTPEDKYPLIVQARHKRGDTGYSVIAKCDYDERGAEVGFFPELEAAQDRGRFLERAPGRWIGNIVGWIRIYDVQTLQVVEEL